MARTPWWQPALAGLIAGAVWGLVLVALAVVTVGPALVTPFFVLPARVLTSALLGGATGLLYGLMGSWLPGPPALRPVVFCLAGWAVVQIIGVLSGVLGRLVTVWSGLVFGVIGWLTFGALFTWALAALEGVEEPEGREHR